MAITPPGDSSQSFRKGPEAKAQEAERQAQKRVQAAHENAKEIERSYQTRLESVKDEYIRQGEANRARHEASLESEKQKAYDAVRKLQMAQAAELRRINKNGESDVQSLQEYYRNAIYSAQKRNDQELEQLRSKQFQQSNFEQEKGLQELEFEKMEHSRRLAHLKEKQDEVFANASASSQEEYAKLAENSALARDQAEKQFHERFERLVETQKQTLGKINAEASAKIGKIRRDTAQKLDAYAARQEDPFYKLKDIDAILHETQDAFILTARIPKHEQQHVQVTLRGDSLVLSGSRRNEETIEHEPGNIQTTSSFQTYSESFPLDFPVERRALRREFDGDRLTVTIPKKHAGEAGAYKSRLAEKSKGPGPEPVRADAPRFPENLPHTDPAEKVHPGDPRYPTGGLSAKSKSSGTLA